MTETARLFQILDDLIDRWCERRALEPLRVVLEAYPPAPFVSDGWATLYASIRNLKGLRPGTLQAEEAAAMAEAHALIYQVLRSSDAGIGILEEAG